MLVTGLLLAGMALTRMDFDAGMRLMGLGQVMLAVWLLRYDIARRTVRQADLSRFIAICLLAGYAWLGLSGMIGLRFGGVMTGPRYDALLHTIFLGFVFSMIFGHAPIILPAITNLAVAYHPVFYVHLGLLQLSLLLRVTGDLWLWLPGRRWGGLLNGVAMLVFLAATAFATLRSRAAGAEPAPVRKSSAIVLTLLLPVPAFVVGLALVILGLIGDADFLRSDKTAEKLSEAALQAGYSPDTVVRGETAYAAYCSSCHGLDARGLPGLGKDLIDSKFVQEASDTALRDFIIAGRPPWDPTNTTGIAMPPRGGYPNLSDKNIDQIIAYLRTVARQ
jgi:cytochrome c5